MKTTKMNDERVGLSKSKTWNKRTKTKTQKLKLRTWSMQDQSTNKIFIAIKKNINMKIIEQNYTLDSCWTNWKLHARFYLSLYPFGDLARSFIMRKWCLWRIWQTLDNACLKHVPSNGLDMPKTLQNTFDFKAYA